MAGFSTSNSTRRALEVNRLRSDPFFTLEQDPVFVYGVPGDRGWLFLSLDGQVHEVSVKHGAVVVSEVWSINPPDREDVTLTCNGVPIEADDQWRIGGRQPFAYNARSGLLVTLMPEGGGQETFEDAVVQIWAFSTQTGIGGPTDSNWRTVSAPVPLQTDRRRTAAAAYRDRPGW